MGLLTMNELAGLGQEPGVDRSLLNYFRRFYSAMSAMHPDWKIRQAEERARAVRKKEYEILKSRGWDRYEREQRRKRAATRRAYVTPARLRSTTPGSSRPSRAPRRAPSRRATRRRGPATGGGREYGRPAAARPTTARPTTARPAAASLELPADRVPFKPIPAGHLPYGGRTYVTPARIRSITPESSGWAEGRTGSVVDHLQPIIVMA
jgi:hypothetical protein